ncbi:MAG TPA: hypothetical protein VN455_04275, partial [Methanotrichaceae archaeon]|nr:hypothetical protein [Methanotrichaceae archaeon]
ITTADSLYSGVWAHAYIPAGADGTNSASSERTVPARTETRTRTLGSNKYNFKTTYGETAVIAKASKTGVLGSAEAFSEGSAKSLALDTAADRGIVAGYAQLVAYAAHSGTGTAEASATGSAEYDTMMSAGQIDASGSVEGSVALNVENNYGGSVKGTAWKGSYSSASSEIASTEGTFSQSFEYLYLNSGRNALSAKSDIIGTVAGGTTASGFYALAGTAKFGNTQSSATGDLSGSATTYKLGDAITPGSLDLFPLPDYATQYNSIAGTERGSSGDIWAQSVATLKASAMLISQCEVTTLPGSPATQKSSAETESMTSAGVTRTLADANEAFGASYIDNGALSSSANTASAAGGSPITLASVGLDTIFMGSGAHLISRLTGSHPASAADLQIHAINTATGAPTSTGSVTILGTANPATANSMVKAVGPAFSTTGTSADATGSYLTAMNLDGTSLHTKDTTAGSAFTSDSKMIATDIDEINVWSWIDGSDPRTHAESAYGVTPYVSTPVYASSPLGPAGTTTGPTTTGSADATTRSVDTIFSSRIEYP